MIKNLAILGVTIIIVSGCSMIQKVGISATGSLLSKANKELTREPDLEFFATSAPSNIQLIEGLWYTDPENEVLLQNLIKGYGGIGFAVSETNHLQYQLKGEDSSFKSEAISHYTKALNYGLKYLELNGISKDLLMNSTKADQLTEKLIDKLDEDDKLAVFYTAQAWGGLINLQRTNMTLMGQLVNVKVLMDWVCSQDPEFEMGSCHLFYGMYEAGRPPMLGGDLEKGKAIFLKFIEKYPYHLLARIAYIQFYIIPMMDETLYNNQSEVLIREFGEWSKVLNKGRDLFEKSPYLSHSQYNLFNAVAKKRFEIIEKNKDDIF